MLDLPSGRKVVGPFGREPHVFRIGGALNREMDEAWGRLVGHDGESAGWVCLATAPDQLLAEVWQQILLEASIPSMLAPQDTMSFLGVTSTPVRVLVPAEALTAARQTLAESVPGHGDHSGPEESC